MGQLERLFNPPHPRGCLKSFNPDPNGLWERKVKFIISIF